MSCCGQITSIRVPIELSNQSDVLKVRFAKVSKCRRRCHVNSAPQVQVHTVSILKTSKEETTPTEMLIYFILIRL